MEKIQRFYNKTCAFFQFNDRVSKFLILVLVPYASRAYSMSAEDVLSGVKFSNIASF
jgi:hypothetical protein